MGNRFRELFSDSATAAKHWIKSHLIMAAIVFVLLFINLSIVNYAIVDFGNVIGIFFISLALAIIDFLPVVGLFFPMAIWSVLAILAEHNTKLGISVIAVCFVIMIIKQIIEPFVVGKSLGISPIEEVLSSIAGYIIIGTNPIGLLLGPIIYVIGKTTYKKIKHQPLFETRESNYFGFDKNTGNRNKQKYDDAIDISDDVIDIDEK